MSASRRTGQKSGAFVEVIKVAVSWNYSYVNDSQRDRVEVLNPDGSLLISFPRAAWYDDSAADKLAIAIGLVRLTGENVDAPKHRH